MNEQRNDLEWLLSKVPHIDDDGFTEAVMAQLPPSRPSLWTRTIILLASTVMSCSIAMAIPGARRFVTDICVGLASGSAGTGSHLFTAGIVVALAVWGAMAAVESEV